MRGGRRRSTVACSGIQNGGSRRPENWRRGFGEAPGDPSDIGRVRNGPGTVAAALVVLLAALGGWMWAYRPYRPPPDAQLAYDRGVDALHSMAYETARKALEQTVAIDPAFALAHASLARAYDELDYTDRAKDAMLRAIAAAQESRLTADAERRLRALQFMVQRDYERAAPLVRQVEAEATGTDRAAAALESGWLAQQMENSGAGRRGVRAGVDAGALVHGGQAPARIPVRPSGWKRRHGTVGLQRGRTVVPGGRKHSKA